MVGRLMEDAANPRETLLLALAIVDLMEAVDNVVKAEAKPKLKVKVRKAKPGKPAMSGASWTDEEKEEMMKHRAAGFSIEEIAKKIGRSKSATQVAISKIERGQKRTI